MTFKAKVLEACLKFRKFEKVEKLSVTNYLRKLGKQTVIGNYHQSENLRGKSSLNNLNMVKYYLLFTLLCTTYFKFT